MEEQTTEQAPVMNLPKVTDFITDDVKAIELINEATFTPPLGMEKDTLIESIKRTKENKSSTFFGSMTTGGKVHDYIYKYTE